MTVVGVLLAAVGVGVGVGLLLRRVFPARGSVVSDTGDAGTADVSPMLDDLTADDTRETPAVRLRTGERIAASALALVALGLMGTAAYFYRDFSGDDTLLYGAVAMVLGGVALLLARGFGTAGDAARIPSLAVLPPVTLKRVGWLPVAAGGALLALLAGINSDPLATDVFGSVHPALQFAAFVGGAGLVTWGMAGAPLSRLPALSIRPESFSPRREWVIVTAILAFAALLRLWDIENAMRVFVDEVHLSTGVAYFWYDHPMHLLRPIGELMPFPRFFPYWMELAVSLFGRNFTGLRLVPILFGVATVGALYLLARTLFDRTTAVVAALILAAFPPAIHFSRIALINIADPLFGILALALLARAQRTGRQGWYALSGALLGMVAYFYVGGRVVFPALMGLWVGGMLLESVRLRGWRPVFDSTVSLRGLVVLVLTAGIIAAPLFLTNATIGYIKPRIQDTGIPPETWQMWLAQGDYGAYLYRLRNAFLIYMTLPETGLYYAGDQPFILSTVAPLFLLGVFQAVGRWRTGAWLPLAWVLLTSVGTSLLEYSTIAARYVLVLPALALLIGIGLRYTAPLVAARYSRALLALVLAAVTVHHIHYYYALHLPRFNEQFRAGDAPDGHDALLRAASLPDGTAAHIISRHPIADQAYADQVLGYLRDDVRAFVVPLEDFDYGYLLRLTCSLPQAFFIERGATTDRIKPLIEQFFPLNPPERSPHPVPFERTMWLYFYDPAARSPDDPRCRPHTP